MTGITIYNVQRVVTPNTDNSELWFLCSAHHIMVIHICMKFQENISNSFQVTERIHIVQKWLVQSSKGNNSKSRQTRVTVHKFYKLCKVSSKYVKGFPTYREDTSTW